MSQGTLPAEQVSQKHRQGSQTSSVRPSDPVAAGRVPPQDIEAEMSLLGSMLLDRDGIGSVVQLIPADESHRFYRPDHRVLFETLVEMYDGNKPIDIIILEDELRRRKLLDQVGGREYLIELSQAVPSAANIEYYARIVRDKGLLRDLIQCSYDMLQQAYDGQEDAALILDDAEKQLFSVTEQRVANQAVSIREFLDETFKQIESREEGIYSGLPAGLTELDDMLSGFQAGDFVVIAARPSMGKTAVGLSMLDHISVDEKVPAAFFSLEMSKLQIAQRMLCSRAHVDMHRMRAGRLSAEEIAQLQLACGHMRNAPIFIDDSPGMSVMELRAKTRRLKMLHEIKVVFVDYLQLMFDRRAGKESRQQEISAISRGLKALARELGIPVVALAQLNRQVEGRTTNRPRMSDLRESGAIEQDADVVILLHREEYYWDKKKRQEQSDGFDKIRGKAELIVDKQRNGPTGIVEVHFNPQYARFDNAAPGYVHDDPGAPPARGGYDTGMSYEGGGAEPGGGMPVDDEEAPF